MGEARRRYWDPLLAAGPFLVAGAAILIINSWMTGSPWSSPYSFGDLNFRSLDLARPHFAAVLLHPWHGLFVYHPFYGLGLGALVYCSLSARFSKQERLLWTSLGFAFLLHLYIQAAWYCWWLGTATFGMRGMAVAGIVVVLAFVRAVQFSSARVRNAMITLALFCCFVSSVLLWGGNSNHTTFASLWNAAGEFASTGDFIRTWLLSIVAGISIALWLRRRDPTEAMTVAGAVVLSGVVASYLGGGLLASEVGVTGATILGLAMSVWFVRSASEAPLPAATQDQRGRATAAAIVSVLLFAAVTILTCRLIVRTEHQIRTGIPAAKDYPLTGTSQIDEIEATYREYLEVPGFEEEKARLREYVDGAKDQ